MNVVSRWLTEPVPRARIVWLRLLIYAYLPIDVLLTSGWVRSHAGLGGSLYQPLRLARMLSLPEPTKASVTTLAAIVVLSGVAAAVCSVTGRGARVAGVVAAMAYLLWMLVAMSYGKVDHDRFAFLIALAVLPTVASVRRDDLRKDQAAGWAVRCIQLAVVATYFLAAWSKIRFGGVNWPTGATLERALLRRHTPLSEWLIDRPGILVPMQFAMILAELSSPLILLVRTDKGRTLAAAAMYAFHLAVFGGVTIIFLPHCFAIASFLPLERFVGTGSTWVRDRRRLRSEKTRISPTLAASRDTASRKVRSPVEEGRGGS